MGVLSPQVDELHGRGWPAAGDAAAIPAAGQAGAEYLERRPGRMGLVSGRGRALSCESLLVPGESEDVNGSSKFDIDHCPFCRFSAAH